MLGHGGPEGLKLGQVRPHRQCGLGGSLVDSPRKAANLIRWSQLEEHVMRIGVSFIAIIFVLSGCASTRHGTDDVESDIAKEPGGATASLIHIPVRENGVIGTLVVPDQTRSYPGVLRLGGAEGGISLVDADAIASKGYAVLALAYFGMEGLPADLEEVPLEYFGKAIAWMKSSPSVGSSRLAIVGISRGSTLALLLPTIYDDFDAVVALAPTHVTWQSSYLDWDRYADRSSFTWRGKASTYVPYDFSNAAAMVGCDETAACAKMYEQSLKQSDRVREALIPVERIHAPVLLLSGKSDSLWPSSAMGNLIMQRLDETKHPYEHRHSAYENAGHCGLIRCYDHVSLDGDPAATEDMRRQLIQFLDRHLVGGQRSMP